jgi:Beta propeller domain
MTRHFSCKDAAVLAGCLLVISGCTGGAAQRAVHQQVAIRPGPVRLTSFHGCGGELAALRKAAEASVGPYGLPGLASSVNGTAYPAAAAGAPRAAAEAGAAAAAPAAVPAYSGTNDYVAGVDEPDLVKTDGRRIVTVARGVLEVIDAASRTVTGRLELNAAGEGIAYQPANLLLSGDHALVLTSAGPVVEGASGSGGSPRPVDGSRLLLIDLAGRPSVMSSYVIEGSLIDARQIGPAVRVVISTQPRLDFPAQPESTSNGERVAANQAVISRAGLDAWLPRYEQTSGGATSTGHIACSAVSRPASYSGANLLTVLTFDLTSDALGSGNGVSIVADGNTVYGTDTSLYVAGDERWLAEASTADAGPGMPAGGASEPGRAAGQQTDIYRFDITSPGPPRFAGGGSVPGYLIDQYALSEWQGYLRVATTTGTSWARADGPPTGAQASSSAVYVLSTRGPVMRLAGHVAGLGRTERIYSVRFMGPVGYVVTFRQTDPLYTVDLSDPAQPRARGSVALTGYSAYLHPASDTRLIGIGRQADAMGHVGGTQVSLFDVSDLAAPARLATFALTAAISSAEFDPHAFLYWPATHLMVVPLQVAGMAAGAPVPPDGVAQAPEPPQPGALVLRIDDSGITKTGFITQPDTANTTGYPGYSPIERSLIIGQTLWTISAAGAMASDLTTFRQQAWVHFAGPGSTATR